MYIVLSLDSNNYGGVCFFPYSIYSLIFLQQGLYKPTNPETSVVTPGVPWLQSGLLQWSGADMHLDSI